VLSLINANGCSYKEEDTRQTISAMPPIFDKLGEPEKGVQIRKGLPDSTSRWSAGSAAISSSNAGCVAAGKDNVDTHRWGQFKL